MHIHPVHLCLLLSGNLSAIKNPCSGGALPLAYLCAQEIEPGEVFHAGGKRKRLCDTPDLVCKGAVE